MQTTLTIFCGFALGVLVFEVVYNFRINQKFVKAYQRENCITSQEIGRLGKLLNSVLKRSVEYDKRIIKLENKTWSKIDV